MSTTTEKVVVIVKPDVYSHSDGSVFAARFRSLGLTAYGDSRKEALDSLHTMFRVFIDDLRSRGALEQRLDRLGVEWHRADAYDGEVVDVSANVPSQTSQDNRQWRKDAADASSELPLAA